VAHQRVLVFAAAAGAVVLAVAPAGAGAPAHRGKLRLTQRLDGAYAQGAVSYLRVRAGKRVVFRGSGAGGVNTSLSPRAGLYRVISYQRPCAGDCSTLTARVDACSRRVRVYPGELSRVSTVTRPGRGCRIRVVEQKAFPSKRRLRAARRYIRERGLASFALVDSHGRLHGFAPHRTYITASVVKAMLLVARLRQLGNRPPSASDRAVLDPMVQASDNDAADVAYGWVGDAGLLAVAKRARMSDLTVPGGHWGNVSFSAADQARLFVQIDELVPRRSRGYARHLLSSIVPYQRWGFSSYSLRRGWHTYFKGGWRTTELGSLVHEAALFERRGRRFSLAVLTDGNPSHDYGTETLRGVAARIFR
jgi:hypothetical protein